MCTVISNRSGIKVSTIEHLMAAIASYQINNLTIEINESEVPILDGSSKIYLDAIKKTGFKIDCSNILNKLLSIR